jgi:hypothetical protein
VENGLSKGVSDAQPSAASDVVNIEHEIIGILPKPNAIQESSLANHAIGE